MYDWCFDSIELRMLSRAEYVRERNLLKDSHVNSHETQSVHKLGWETGWADSCFLKFHLAALLRRADYIRCLKLLTS